MNNASIFFLYFDIFPSPFLFSAEACLREENLIIRKFFSETIFRKIITELISENQIIKQRSESLKMYCFISFVMDKIDELLLFLSNGSLHTIEEVAERLQTTQEKVKLMAELLQEFDFIQIDRHNIRIENKARKLLESMLSEI